MLQFVTRVDAELARRVDDLVQAGTLASRSEAVRIALNDLADRLERASVAASIVAGYERMPQTAGEVGWADESTRRMIAEEQW
jgi:Arc/MetJ-type ribon-helix-helix transcriptional regulator